MYDFAFLPIGLEIHCESSTTACQTFEMGRWWTTFGQVSLLYLLLLMCWISKTVVYFIKPVFHSRQKARSQITLHHFPVISMAWRKDPTGLVWSGPTFSAGSFRRANQIAGNAWRAHSIGLKLFALKTLLIFLLFRYFSIFLCFGFQYSTPYVHFTDTCVVQPCVQRSVMVTQTQSRRGKNCSAHGKKVMARQSKIFICLICSLFLKYLNGNAPCCQF